MYSLIVGILIVLFLGLLALNVFFRVKVLKLYKYLVRNKVEFEFVHFFNEEKLKDEVISKYPDHEKEVRDFIEKVKFSMTLASGILFLIIILGYTLLKFRTV